MNSSEPPRPFEATDLFYRAIPEDYIDFQRGRISSGAFSNTKRTDEMSVDWAFLSTPDESMARWQKPVAIGQFTKRVCDELEQQCVHKPRPTNPAHCGIIGRKAESVAKRFARETRLALWPEGWDIPGELQTQ